MLRFSQWWRRQVRGGYGGLDIATRFERHHNGTFTRQVRSARIWTIGWIVTLVLVSCAASVWGWQSALLAGGIVAGAVPLQACRIAVKARSKGAGFTLALVHGFLTMLGKWAQLFGQLKYARDRAKGRGVCLIEHKETPAEPVAPAVTAEASK